MKNLEKLATLFPKWGTLTIRWGTNRSDDGQTMTWCLEVESELTDQEILHLQTRSEDLAVALEEFTALGTGAVRRRLEKIQKELESEQRKLDLLDC